MYSKMTFAKSPRRSDPNAVFPSENLKNETKLSFFDEKIENYYIC